MTVITVVSHPAHGAETDAIEDYRERVLLAIYAARRNHPASSGDIYINAGIELAWATAICG